MWYDKIVVKILLLVAKILSRKGESSFAHEIGELEKFIFESEENK